ncbi:uncharacterized protein LOC124542439 [Vanessa cardui]|uniref:uncharacterized protein LOC124542439 n=1 Tax=Vanessa cardui TaxID=171605 RepID=UPI001F13FF58|nr:uncharacterized protein LOC124542439 [Vanessa cardui]
MSGSDTDAFAVELADRQAKKRAYLRQSSACSSDSAKSNPKKRTNALKPYPSITHEVGLLDAPSYLNGANRARIQQELEEEVAAKEAQARVRRAKADYGSSNVSYTDHSLAELEKMAEEDQEEIARVASKSSNLKGTFQKALKCRAASLRGIIGELVHRTTTDEVRQLQKRVDCLTKEVSDLHTKLAEAVGRPVQAPPSAMAVELSSSSLEETIRRIMMEERAFTRACIAGIEDRLLPEKRVRPPLAADRTVSASAAPPDVMAPPPPPTPKPAKGKGKGKKTVGRPATTDAAAPSSQTEDAFLPASTPSNEWTEVVRRKKKKRGAKKSVLPAASANVPSGSSKGTSKGEKTAPKPNRRKLVPPKTAAVVVTLTTDAKEKGETYESVLKRARTNANPAALGIGLVKCRRTQTGARLFEFPGAQGGANADLFANKLQEVIADVVKVARPTKTVTLELTDLDDSVTKEEVLAAVAFAGGCDVAAIQGGAIKPGRGGLGAIRLKCPIVAAKAVLAKRRLPVGFCVAVVRALEDRPFRCFRCFGIGHTRALCPSRVDRSELCCRCGEAGHKASECSAATPRCAVCTASGRPAGHVMGGKQCNPPPRKGQAQVPTRPAAAAVTATPVTAPATEGESAMIT